MRPPAAPVVRHPVVPPKHERDQLRDAIPELMKGRRAQWDDKPPPDQEPS